MNLPFTDMCYGVLTKSSISWMGLQILGSLINVNLPFTGVISVIITVRHG